MIKYVVDFDGLMQSDFEKKNQRPNSLCVCVCICILQLCGFANVLLALVFAEGNIGTAGAGEMLRLQSSCVYVSVFVCGRPIMIIMV